MEIKLPLETERLIIRDFVESDWRSVHEYGSDPEVVKFMPFGPNIEDSTKDFINRSIHMQGVTPRMSFEFAVVRKSDNKLIGGCGMRIKSVTHKTADLGYILRRDCWNMGYTTEVVKAILAFGFDQLGMHRIWATCDVENKASERVMIKAGMVREGHIRDHMFIRGWWRDSYLYAILEQDWRETNK